MYFHLKAINNHPSTKALRFLLFVIHFLVLACFSPHAMSSVDDSFKVLDFSEKAYNGGNALAITFNQTLKSSQNIDKYLHVSGVFGSVDGAWVLSKNLKVAYFEHIEPKETYRVNILPGLQSSQGQRIHKSIEKLLKTRDIKPSVTFASNGNFLPINLSKGIVVNSVNVDEVNIDFFRIDRKNTGKFLNYAQNRLGSRWYHSYLDSAANMGELVYSGRYQLATVKNKLRSSTIGIDQIKDIHHPGLYFAVMTIPGQYSGRAQFSYFSITDIGIHARVFDEQIDVYLSSISNGTAFDKGTVSLFDKNGIRLHSVEVTSDGYANFNNYTAKADYIMAVSDNHFSYLKLNGPALDLSEFDLGLKKQHEEEIFIYSPRDLYRPGETVDLSALRRGSDGQPLVDIPLSVKILRPDRVVAHSFTWHGLVKGYYQHQYQLADSAKTGNWVIQVSGINAKPVEYQFKVEDFLPERMEMEFNNNSSESLFFDEKEIIKIPITGRYLYGAPADGNRVSTRVFTRKAKSAVKNLKGYQFGHEGKHDNQNFYANDFKLDENGNGTIVVKPQWQNTNSALDVFLTSSLYESGGRPINRVYKTTVWPQTAMLGIRPDFGEKNPPQNSLVGFNVVKSTSSGLLLNASELNVTLIKENRNYFWEHNVNSGWRWNWTEKEYPVYSQTLDLDSNKLNQIKVPVEYGRYRLEIVDPSNNNQLSSVRFHAGKDWYYWWKENNRQNVAIRPDQVNLAFDAEHYQAGDVAKLRVVSPHSGQAIITVESDQLLWFKRTHVDDAGTTIEIPINKNWLSHNIYVSAVVFKGGDSTNLISPNRAIGVTHLPLNRQSRRLKVELNTAEKLLPNRTHNIKVKVHGQDKPQKKYITLAAVDVGVLAISQFDTPDPYDAFFGQKRYAADQRDMYAKIIELKQAQSAKLRFGGDAELARGGMQAKADVQIVSLFSGLVDVDANGNAEIALDIPDFNGRLRLMAVAFDDDSFGSSEQEVTVASPLVAQISMPRFLAFGDQAKLALDLTNLSGNEQIFDFDLKVTSPLNLTSDLSKKIALADGEKQTLFFTVNAEKKSGQGEVHLNITDENGLTIKKSWKLSVRSAYPSTTETLVKVLNAGESINFNEVVDPSDYHSDSLQSLVSISSEADLKLSEQLNNLISYPYGCLEQTSSKAYPLAYANMDTLRNLGLKSYSQIEIQDRIDRGMQRLGSLQKSNGSFGLWNAQSREEHWLTAYAADFMLTAKNNGYEVSDSIFTATMKRLQRNVRHRGKFYQQKYSRSPQHYSIASKAYAAYLLTQVNKVTLGTLRTLYDTELQAAETPLPLLHLGIALIELGDKKRGDSAIKQALAMPIEKRTRYYGDYGSLIRDVGLMIHLLIKHDIQTDRATALGFKLAEETRPRRYLSTQERNALFLAGIALQSIPSKSWQAAIRSDDELIINGKGYYSRLLNHEKLAQELILSVDKGQSINTSISVAGYLKKPPQPYSNGLSVNRQYFNSEGESIYFKHIKTGDLILVKVTLNADQRTPDALYIDLLPAGFELENQNLATAISLDRFKINGDSISNITKNSKIEYQEFRDDRFVAAIDIGRNRKTEIVYLMRAVTPGDFSVPSPIVEDMYRPEIRSIGKTVVKVSIEDKQIN